MKQKQYVVQSCVIAVLAAIALPIGMSAAHAAGHFVEAANSVVIKQ